MFQFIKASDLSSSEYRQWNTPLDKDLISCSDRLNIMTAGKEKYLTVFGGYCINFMIGGYVAVGNVIPYLVYFSFILWFRVCSFDVQLRIITGLLPDSL